MTEFQLRDVVKVSADSSFCGGKIGIVFTVAEDEGVARVGHEDGCASWNDFSHLTLVSRPSQQLVPVTLEDVEGFEIGDSWFTEYTMADKHGGRFPQIATDDSGYRKHYRLVDSELSMEPSVAQCAKALVAVIQIEIDHGDQETERLKSLQGAICNYAEL